MTSLAAARESLRRNNVANWNTLSDAAVARMFGGRLPIASKPAPKNEGPKLERIEEQALRNMPFAQKAIYLALREAAMAGDYAPTREGLGEAACIGATQTAKYIKRLETRGAIVRIPTRQQNRPAAYRLPWIGRETRS